MSGTLSTSRPTGIYGPGIGGDSLANITVGSAVCPKRWFIRFRAERNGSIVSVRLPYLGPAEYPTYASGTGGRWQVSAQWAHPSNPIYPIGPESGTLAPPTKLPSKRTSANGMVIGIRPMAVVSGHIYFIVIENTDPAPDINYFSINTWHRIKPEIGRLNPRFSDLEWSCGYFWNGEWHDHKAHCPIADIAYADGHHQGMSYGEASKQQPGRPVEDVIGLIDREFMVAETFQISRPDFVTTGGGIRLAAATPGHCDVILWRDNSIAAAAMIDGSSIPLIPTGETSGASATWQRFRWKEPISLRSGGKYRLTLSCNNGALWTWPQRRLTKEYGYHRLTAFEDGWAEHSVDGGGSWDPLGRVPHEYDLQFYLNTT